MAAKKRHPLHKGITREPTVLGIPVETVVLVGGMSLLAIFNLPNLWLKIGVGVIAVVILIALRVYIGNRRHRLRVLGRSMVLGSFHRSGTDQYWGGAAYGAQRWKPGGHER